MLVLARKQPKISIKHKNKLNGVNENGNDDGEIKTAKSRIPIGEWAASWELANCEQLWVACLQAIGWTWKKTKWEDRDNSAIDDDDDDDNGSLKHWNSLLKWYCTNERQTEMGQERAREKESVNMASPKKTLLPYINVHRKSIQNVSTIDYLPSFAWFMIVIFILRLNRNQMVNKKRKW